MNNFKKISKRAAIGIMLLAIFIYFSPSAIAVSAEKGNFIILGKAMNEDEQGKVVYEDESVALWAQPGAGNIKLGKAESGTRACVLDKAEAGQGNFYFIKTVSGQIGLMGWVSEDYIYQITDAPVI